MYDVIKTRGVVQLTSAGVVRTGESGPSGADDKRPLLDDGARYWELRVTHGNEVLASVLSGKRYFDYGQDGFESEMRAAIEKSDSEIAWSVVDSLLAKMPPEQRGSFLAVILSELHEEPLRGVWLAVLAQHAANSGNEFAFGYLTALIDQLRENEHSYLRGESIVENARKGGAARAANAASQRTLAEMKSRIDDGQSVRQAAKNTRAAGFGSSGPANRKLWYRWRKS